MLSESEIDKQIVNYFDNIGLEWHWRNQVYKGRVKSGAYLHTGKKGVSDRIAIWKGVTYYIEVKDHKYKQSKEQKEFELYCKENNQIYILARSVDDVRKYIKRGPK